MGKKGLLFKSLIIIFLVLFFDQLIKFYVKTNYALGEEHSIIGNWFHFHFIENEGMAFGWKLKNSKLFLSLFRIFAATAIGWYLIVLIKKRATTGFVLCLSLIFAGAVGNILDSAFYGLLFSESVWGGKPSIFMPEDGGYARFLYGSVVDMFYFPLVSGTWPSWVPFGLGGTGFQFFRPVFNLADASITTGVLTLIVFQKRLLHSTAPQKESTSLNVEPENDTVQPPQENVDIADKEISSSMDE